MTLYLLKFNNYYNRIVKKFDSISGYSDFVLDSFEGINFNPNDSINTEQIINYTGEQPDYVIVCDEDNKIVSRWYVTASQRTRAQQYRMVLYRDVIADWYDDVIKAPMFVEKALLQQSDPLIFNSEDMTFNQIKTSETLLKDETKCAWLVGYCTRDTAETSISSEIKYHAPVDIAVSNITAYEYYNNSNLATNPQPLSGFPQKIIYNVYGRRTVGSTPYIDKYSFNANGDQTTGNYVYSAPSSVAASNGHTTVGIDQAFTWTGTSTNKEWYPRTGTTWPAACLTTSYSAKTSITSYIKAGFTSYYSTLASQLPAYLTVKSEADTIKIKNQNGKTIYDAANDAYYQVSVTENPATETEIMISSGSMYNTFVAAMTKSATIYDSEYSSREPGDFAEDIMGGTPNSGSFSVRIYGATYNITLTRLPDQALTYTATFPDDRYQLEDAPYDMFCMPFSDDLAIYKNGVKKFDSSKSLAWQTFMSLASKYKSAGFIYDIQLLPYCPVRYCLTTSGTFDVGNNIVGTVNKTENNNTSTVAYILFGSKASDNFVIPYNISITDNKVQGQTDIWRLVSPNYSGQFEFNAAKNNGVEYVEVDYTYKPYTPYIHVAPNFKNLYGQDFNDARGLICGGDYSLPSVSSAWDTYELQNKNYQLAFDRQIQNMEVQNKYQKTMDIVNAVTGTLAGGAGGAFAGSAGGPWGMLAGGITGTIAAGVGGAIDVSMKEDLRKEALDYTKDQFGYQLGNIKALPYTLNKVSAFNTNNKIFPFIEYYTCTEIEKAALIDKIRYNGMTVGKIGTIEDYIYNTYRDFDKQYIKGKLIRLDSLANNFQIVNAIANELNKGVFI